MQGPLLAMSTSESNKARPITASPEKKGDKSPIIDLKNGKVVCKQKAVSFEKQSETLQEIVKFREMLENLIESDHSPLTEIPEEHRPVIAKLAHESDKGLGPLAKHIRQELLPVQDDEDTEKTAKANAILPQPVVEAAINSVLNRNNYGLDVPLGVKLPATLAVWRWEVKDSYWEWLPKGGKEKAEARLEERKSAKKAVNAVFDALPQAEKDTILRIKGSKLKDVNGAETSTPEPSDKTEVVVVESAKKQGKKKADEPSNDENGNTPAAASKQPKPVDPEKAAKEKERLEKKAAKAEKERKAQEAHKKSRTIMSNFFSKPKAPIAPTRVKVQATALPGPSSTKSDFEKVFKPFVLKRDSVLAPTNWFKESQKRKRVHHSASTDPDIIVIDDEDTPAKDITMSEPLPTEAELSRMTEKERLNSILSSLPPAVDPSRLTRRRKLPPGYLTYHPLAVRDVVNQLSEAEVAGDDQIVRSLLTKLQDRKAFPAKVFIFREDARPGYYGTWTRSSRIIGPRRPLAKDLLVFDYGYDSGEEWEEEPVGEDVAEDDEDEEDPDADDSDADSWLVEDDEEPEIVNLSDIDSITPPDLFGTDLPPLPKRKADDPEKKQNTKKRKVVVPLVPFAKGPFWENRIGECSYDPFKAYQIQLFNDTPFPIDPFTYVSTCNEDHRAHLKAQSAPANPPPTTQDGFAIPPVPLRLVNTPSGLNPLSSNAAAPSSTAFTSTPNTPTPAQPIPTTQKKPPALRAPFPDAHLPFLINKIAELETSSFVLLVETIYEALKPNKVTKAAVEAKIREVGEKDKVKKKWVLKPAFAGNVNVTQTSTS
ncbi:CoCAF-1 [Ephemerocybe angulata]|uniref:CoCAF-1 n=1 Tax=Ephemerocybe angulata TaxID=980116 RepID=A0A8H6MFV9_9AGAR|nr:CoCAF-1 [Tulosesus angulatus]